MNEDKKNITVVTARIIVVLSIILNITLFKLLNQEINIVFKRYTNINTIYPYWKDKSDMRCGAQVSFGERNPTRDAGTVQCVCGFDFNTIYPYRIIYIKNKQFSKHKQYISRYNSHSNSYFVKENDE